MKTKSIPHHSFHLRDHLHLILAVIIVFLLLNSLDWISSSKVSTKSSPSPTEKAGTADHETILAKSAKYPIDPNLIGVHIFRQVNEKMEWHCTGALITSRNHILTSGHAFASMPGKARKPANYYYKKLNGTNNEFQPISGVDQNCLVNRESGATADFLVLSIGSVNPIIPIPDTNYTPTDKIEDIHFQPFIEPFYAQSSVTGKFTKVIGICTKGNGLTYTVINYKCISGESGTVFKGGDGMLYIICGGVVGPPTQYGDLTLCTSVKSN